MQIVINIPKEFEKEWNDTKFAESIQRVMCDLRDYPNHDKMSGNYEFETLEMLRDTFRNGTQLPKGHGRLIDENELIDGIVCEEIDGRYYDIVYANCIYDAATIIEADKEVENENTR